ncbi:MAG TPA: cytochrome c3 family protein, partial [Gemmatimonadaceae bacterium]|nr:cytochrome c3 family protein [Gemmatimonadaceae bacterium]
RREALRAAEAKLTELRATTPRNNVRCDKCHADRTFLVGKARSELGDSVLFVTDAMLEDSRHARLDCADCHVDYDDGYPHATRKVSVPCERCHESAGTTWKQSIHAPNFEQKGDAPTCVSCHSSHRVLGTDDSRSPTYTLNVARLCGSCHNEKKLVAAYFKDPADSSARTAVASYKRSVHGTALSKAGLVVTATCNDCHGAHLVLPVDSTASTLNRANVAETCGACHAGVLSDYAVSAHGKALTSGDTTATGDKAPVCVDCHGGHKMVAVNDPEWFRGTVQECGACHERLLATYSETYHGQVTELGGELAARCSDCHTAHAMLPAKDPQSSVHASNLVATCAKCHEGANEKFVQFKVHADVRDRAKNPLFYWVWRIMTTILLGTFTVFGLHSILFFIRLKLDRGKHAHAHAAPAAVPSSPAAAPADGPRAPDRPDTPEPR